MVCVCKLGHIFAVRVLWCFVVWVSISITAEIIILIIAISVLLAATKCTKFVFGRGSAPDPAGGAHDVPPCPLVGWGGDTPSPFPSPRRLDSHAFSVRLSAFGPRFWCLRRSSRRLRYLASSVPPLLFSQFKHRIQLPEFSEFHWTQAVECNTEFLYSSAIALLSKPYSIDWFITFNSQKLD